MKFWQTCLALTLLIGIPLGAGAEVESLNLREVSLKAAMKDMAMTRDGRLLVLEEGGRLSVYDGSGKSLGQVEVDARFDRILTDDNGDRIILGQTGGGQVQVVTLEFIQQIGTAGSPFQGPADAPVTIAVFTDFQCPYCARVVPLLEEALKKYPKQVKVVFKNYPLSSHQMARPAAMAALAAGEQGKFWPFHDRLFAQYNQISEELIEKIARDLGLDMEKFARDRTDPRKVNFINRDIQDARQAGVRGTPTIFVNGRLLRNRSLEGISELVDRELARTSPPASPE